MIEIYKKLHFKRMEISFSWRSRKNLWGRFGGGWQWKVGFQAGGRTIIFNLLVLTICVSFEKKQK